jgi:hypothetical protein
MMAWEATVIMSMAVLLAEVMTKYASIHSGSHCSLIWRCGRNALPSGEYESPGHFSSRESLEPFAEGLMLAEMAWSRRQEWQELRQGQH